ncbi:hypothetical protein [Methylocystis iwaonis]|uniref:Apea-like HEPN domain-containing protein n=1 Tax=Methylocystis iwaonis TaxID=2885079 RepID=A0ABN6VLL2_9HYPH|nr:hypothetical protein [Methylocystis iwaonis]BDV36569.1 hypothetical protein SS37A_40990 [Methylocystis iwaonis]BDV36669.1 hypothetical protein SS37A_41990 [Methylocystis iwaonis]
MTAVINFANFQIMEPETKDLVLELMQNADRQRSAFMSFVNIWMAFNGWMAAITERETDADMIRDLSVNRRLTDAYAGLMENSRAFHRLVYDFSAMWPVLNVRDVRKKLGRDAFWRLHSDEFAAACSAANVKRQPSAWNAGDRPSWEQLLRTIYQVRCNLFHGEKSPQNVRDRQLILKSDRILRTFIVETGCFEWHA